MELKQGDFKEGGKSEVNSCLTETGAKYDSYFCFHYIYTVDQKMDIIREDNNGVVPWDQANENVTGGSQEMKRRLVAD